MSEIKKEQNEHADTQKQHLEDINKQLQAYLYNQQRQLEERFSDVKLQLPKLNRSPNDDHPIDNLKTDSAIALPRTDSYSGEPATVGNRDSDNIMAELVQDGRAEIYKLVQSSNDNIPVKRGNGDNLLLRIAYAKLPYVLSRRRQFMNNDYAYRSSP